MENGDHATIGLGSIHLVPHDISITINGYRYLTSTNDPEITIVVSPDEFRAARSGELPGPIMGHLELNPGQISRLSESGSKRWMAVRYRKESQSSIWIHPYEIIQIGDVPLEPRPRTV